MRTATARSLTWLGGSLLRIRALWRPEEISEIFVASASPEAIGLSSVVGLLDPTPRSAPYGLHLRLTDPKEAETVLTVPLAPGLVVPVGVAEKRRVQPGETAEIEPVSGSIALGDKCEIEVGPEDRVKVRPDTSGPLTIGIEATMQEAAQRGLLNGNLFA